MDTETLRRELEETLASLDIYPIEHLLDDFSSYIPEEEHAKFKVLLEMVALDRGIIETLCMSRDLTDELFTLVLDDKKVTPEMLSGAAGQLVRRGRQDLLEVLVSHQKFDEKLHNTLIKRLMASENSLKVIAPLASKSLIPIEAQIEMLMRMQLHKKTKSNDPLETLSNQISDRSHFGFGSETSMNKSEEQKADVVSELLKEKYPKARTEGMQKLRELIFDELIGNLKNEKKSLEGQEKSDLVTRIDEKIKFLEKNKGKVILGDEKAYKESIPYIDSNENMYEIAFRALNPYAKVTVWQNLLTTNDWTQQYAGQIALAVNGLKETPSYANAIYELVYRIYEIRRAHNEGSTEGIDNPSCFPGTKTRLAQVLSYHPDYKDLVPGRVKTEALNAARSYVEKAFKEHLKTRSFEEGEALLNALICFNMEDIERIKKNEPLVQINGVYDESFQKERNEFIGSIAEGLAEEVRRKLADKSLSYDEAEARELSNYATVNLGEGWIAPTLTSIFEQQYRDELKKRKEEDSELANDASFREETKAALEQQRAFMPGMQAIQKRQQLKRAFFDNYKEKTGEEFDMDKVDVVKFNALFPTDNPPNLSDENDKKRIEKIFSDAESLIKDNQKPSAPKNK